jgi:hypothetical protein
MTRAMVERTCERCGAAFTTRASYVKRGGGRFCSRKCTSPPTAPHGTVSRYRRGCRCQPCTTAHTQTVARQRAAKAAAYNPGTYDLDADYPRRPASDGYWYVTVDGHRLLEHRFVMEQLLGRRLRPGETVHHRNGQHGDNRPENLELRVKLHPKGSSIAEAVAYARELLAEYEPLLDRLPH